MTFLKRAFQSTTIHVLIKPRSAVSPSLSHRHYFILRISRGNFLKCFHSLSWQVLSSLSADWTKVDLKCLCRALGVNVFPYFNTNAHARIHLASQGRAECACSCNKRGALWKLSNRSRLLVDKFDFLRETIAFIYTQLEKEGRKYSDESFLRRFLSWHVP